ncbi:MAG: hypothetical protein O8C60_04640, partial [Candidatus Methanoperedens sp.]|nr:hypothetical protein [Candidatus Methanoperedens sp.]
SSGGSILIFWLKSGISTSQPRISQLGWDVDIDRLKLIVLAPDTKFKNAGLDMTVLEQVKRLNCEVAAAYIDPGWIKDDAYQTDLHRYLYPRASASSGQSAFPSHDSSSN